MEVRSQESSSYFPEYLGGRGIAAKIAWDEYPKPVDPFSPQNPLMIFPGALGGTKSPYSGRTTVCAFSPQGYPYQWFTRSNIGGWIGGNIKRAGYDGIIITGKAEAPARIRVTDDEIAILPADGLWGVDIFDTLEELEKLDGDEYKSLVIGPAGERLSSIATIQTGTSSACGQGGFGAVMGSKNLKAVSVTGTYEVKPARPEALRDLTRQIARTAKPPKWFGMGIKEHKEAAAKEGGSARLRACTEGCVTPCQTEFEMPGKVHKRTWRGDWVCVATVIPGLNSPNLMGASKSGADNLVTTAFDYRIDQRTSFEINVLTNRYGLNQFDIIAGMVPWLVLCQKAGLISDINGVAIDWNSPEFWDTFLHAVAYREGIGDKLAEGTWRAARLLDLGKDIAERIYPGWAQSWHWDGHNLDNFPFPFWISSTLQWLADTRDPFSTGHGSLACNAFTGRVARAESEEDRDRILSAARDWSRHIYGTESAADPYSGYEGKARVGYFHTIRPVIKDCVPVDDLTFPLLFNSATADYRSVLKDRDGNDIDGKDVEYHLFRLGTGVEWSKEEFEQSAVRVYNLERALVVRHWGRDRSIDEMVLPYFEETETFQNPLLQERYGLDRAKFGPVLDEFYALHGWDPATGWPTRESLDRLGLTGVYDDMIAGAASTAREGAYR